jgi:hypothetical protein
MRKVFGLLVLVGFGLALAAKPLVAHHAFAAEFDKDRPIKLQGKVIKMQWINPHPWIHIEVTGKDGKPTVWMIEASAPNNLLRRGFTRDSLPPGTMITVEGYQALDGAQRANGTALTFADGRHLFIGSVGTGAPVEQ